ncbi:Calcipressin [Calocera viscosa TUFC12733]|uniref:Calcipressin n=1 Tax=Calocera viscosa (strain TUFC12733) TaxID=1330018 RepID=A0A167I8I7_CALVF|nr:Calcipressin [Calocera viscosa TUFC12733]
MQTPLSSRPPSLSVSVESEQPTNTLIIPNLPPAFFLPSVLEALKQHFASYGELYAWTPLKGFKRILVVYYDVEDAEAARESDNLVIGHERDLTRSDVEHVHDVENDSFPAFTLRVYRGDPTPLNRQTSTLHPPEIEHNYLISPPGSPPVGWEQVREEPPNQDTLAHDLVRALEQLKIEREMAGHPHEPHVLVSGEDEEGRRMPRVVVQDADLEQAAREELAEWNITVAPVPRLESVRTARPPVAGE